MMDIVAEIERIHKNVPNNIEAIKGKIMVEYLTAHGIYNPRKFKCLNHELHKNSDHKPSMSFHTDKDGIYRVYCFACGTRYDLLGLIMKLERKDRRNAECIVTNRINKFKKDNSNGLF